MPLAFAGVVEKLSTGLLWEAVGLALLALMSVPTTALDKTF
jgi:hypothetical protein